MKKYELFVKLELDIEWQIRVDIINFYKDYYNYLREVVKKPCIIINKNQFYYMEKINENYKRYL